MKSGKRKIYSALLEIGVEELPARFIPPALDQLKSLANAQLMEKAVPFESLEVMGSPRRLSLLVHGLPEKTLDRTEILIGPPPKAAKDDQNHWTPAATGFAKAQGVPVATLILETTIKGERYVSKRVLKGQKTETVLADIFPTLIKMLSFPKNMVWEQSRFYFARPIRWIVALFHTRIVRFKIAGVTSDHSTFGLLALGGQKMIVPSPEKYKSLLQNRCILVSPDDRRKKIVEQIEAISKKHKVTPITDDDHLMEVVNITEYPVGIVGQFNESYLSIPKEILISVLRKHQKFFPLESQKKQLTNLFIGVRNGPSESQETVREGYERVLAARLADAKFFFDQDSHTSLEVLSERLSEIGFHEKLGSMKDKKIRVATLVSELGKQLHCDEPTVSGALRATTLAKADLLTHIVGEFPELQGIAGRFYSAGHEPKEVAQAVEQHYWPLTAMGELPQHAVSALVALADKMDTLAANFGVGLIPSGSADPYGLRRAALGVLRILLKFKWNLPVSSIVELAVRNLPSSLGNNKAAQDLLQFMNQRCGAYFESQGYRPDEIEAVLSSTSSGIVVMELKLKGLKSVRSQEDFLFISAAIKRARNILAQAKEKGVMPVNGHASLESLSGAPEQRLFDSLLKTQPQVDALIKEEKFSQAMLALVQMKQPIDQFFSDVMVMVDDEHTRSQRLSLLSSVKQLFDSVVDFSKLVH